MALTPAQIILLAADIQTHPELSVFYLGAANDNVAVRDYYNAPDPTLADCWRTSFSLGDALAVTNWTEFIGRSQGERDAFRMMFMVGPVKPSARDSPTSSAGRVEPSRGRRSRWRPSGR